jgi:TRAP-type C4-dicarboxylate transport system substrate-binding protein
MSRCLIVSVLAVALFGNPALADALMLKVLGQPVGSGLIQKDQEQPFFEQLAERSGLDVKVQYIPVDVAGIPDTDGLRVLKSGLFDIVSIRGPQVSRDEPEMLGFDLVGLNPTFEAGKKHVAAYLPTVDKSLQSKFNAKLLGMWPAGPQIIFCKPAIKSLSDLKGLKVRVGDQSAANFVGGLGATGVPMPFGEVQQSLARGVVDCAITGPASANSAGWPEAATTVLPISLQLAMNGYAINLDRWKKLSGDDQAKLQKAIDSLVSNIWVYSKELYDDAMRCNVGADPCKRGKPYHLTAVPVTEQDLKTVKEALGSRSLPVWFKQCNATDPKCEADWKATVGVALGL